MVWWLIDPAEIAKKAKQTQSKRNDTFGFDSVRFGLVRTQWIIICLRFALASSYLMFAINAYELLYLLHSHLTCECGHSEPRTQKSVSVLFLFVVFSTELPELLNKAMQCKAKPIKIHIYITEQNEKKKLQNCKLWMWQHYLGSPRHFA